MINVKVDKTSVTAQVSSNQSKINNADIKLVKGDKGTVFTPHVDDLSNLSWSNDGGLENPPTRNIRGKDGSTNIDVITNMDIEKIIGG